MKLYDAIKLALMNAKRNKNKIYITLIIIMTILSMGLVCFKNSIKKELSMVVH